ncbi:MAG: hypothetical protein V1806_05880 [Pseudomonadota bacterium]
MAKINTANEVVQGLLSALSADQRVVAARNALAAESGALVNLRSQGESYRERIARQENRQAELEERRLVMLGNGQAVDQLEAELIEAEALLGSLRGWNKDLESRLLPQARKAEQEASAHLARATSEAIAEYMNGLQGELRMKLLTVGDMLQAWSEAKAAAWGEVGLNPDRYRHQAHTAICLPDLVPEMKKAFGFGADAPGKAF